MSAETIRRLYDALDRHDGEAAAACYTDDAVFRDPAFGRLTDGAVKDMWRMLCERSDDLAVELVDHGADGPSGWARWSASYTFTGTGRSVVNDIRARFTFRDDLIAEQEDSFSLRRWGGQALGRRATVMGTTPLLGLMVRRQTRRQLGAYSQKT
jgi:ketosteroid isomerase-like protein